MKRYILTIGLPLIIFIFIAINVVYSRTAGFDSFIYNEVSKYIIPHVTKIMILISYFGSGVFLAVSTLIICIIFYFDKKDSFYSAMIIMNLVLSSLLNVTLKHIIHRARPDILKLVEVAGFSFPSGHSMAAMSFYGFFIFLCFKYCKSGRKYIMSSLLAAMIFLIGLSRIYLGVHYASDVLGGFTLGVLWLGVFTLIIDKSKAINGV